MTMERGRQDLLLGIVFFAALGVLLWATMNVTGLSLGQKTQERTVRFPQAAGLQAGDNVFVLGHRFGQVQRIEYERDAPAGRRIVVDLMFERPVVLTNRYRVQIREGSLLGGRQVEVDPGDGDQIVPPGDTLQGEVSLGALASLGDLFADGSVETDLKSIVSGLRSAIDRANRGEGTLGRILTDSKLYDEALGAVQSARASLEEIQSGRGAIGKAIYDQKVGDDLARIVDNVDAMVADARAGKGLLGAVLTDESIADKTRQIVDDVSTVTADVRAGKGAAGLLFRDEATAADLERITGGFADLADNVNDPNKGLIGALVADGEMRARAQRFVDDLADISTEIRMGNGLVSRLVYDDELGEEFSRVLNQVSRAIEDAREAAPVSTFFQVFSGAY